MLRKFLSVAVAMALFAGAAAAGDKKASDEDKPDKAKPVFGKVKKIDAEKGILIVTVKKGDEEEDVEIKIGEGTTFTIPPSSGRGKPTMIEGKDGLKAKELKAGVMVSVTAFGKGKQNIMLMIRGGGGRPIGPSRNMVMGSVKKADAEKGVLTLTVKEGEDEKDKDIKITDDVLIMVAKKNQRPKQVETKAAMKDKDLLKEGTKVVVFNAPNGKTIIMVGAFSGFGPLDPRDPAKGNAGKIKKVDAEKGILIVTIEGKDVEIKATEDTKFQVFGKVKPLSAKEALKMDEFKEGALVQIMKDKEGNIHMIRAVPAIKKPIKPEE